MPNEPLPAISASSFRLCDDDGRVCAILTHTNGDPTFALLDRAGNTRITVSLDDNGNGKVMLADADGMVRAGLDLFDDGPSLFMRDQTGAVRFGIDAEGDDGAVVTFTDAHGNVRLSLSSRESANGSEITLRDDHERARVVVHSVGDDHSFLSVDETGKVRTLIANDKAMFMDGDGGVVIFPPSDGEA